MTKRFRRDSAAQVELANTKKLADVSADDFDAVFYPGGHGPMWDMPDNATSIALIEAFVKADKPVGAVCHASVALVNARGKDGAYLVKGKHVTGSLDGQSNRLPSSAADSSRQPGAAAEPAKIAARSWDSEEDEMRRWQALVLAAVATIAFPCNAQTVSAKWVKHEVTLTYMGVTTHYSCSGLRDTVKGLLIELGAQPGFTVSDAGCSPMERPTWNPSVDLRFASLQPANGTDALNANWKAVDLVTARRLGPGDCELARQVVVELLPLFASRNLVSSTVCVPNQTTGDVVLKLDVLTAKSNS